MICDTFDNPADMYFRMVRDIAAARRRVYLEMYIFIPDRYGILLRDAFTDAAKRGVEVKILLDSWGTDIRADFFRDTVRHGGEIRIFRQLRLSPKVLKQHHRRNHRKLLVVDDSIFYIGSANISEVESSWWQLSARIEDGNSGLAEAFLDSFNLYNRHFHSVKKRIIPIKGDGYTILRDVPSLRHQRIRAQLLWMIRKAKERIFIESPYFIPDLKFFAALRQAAKRGTHVTIIVPKHSDVRMADFLANSYLGLLHKAGIHIYLYNPRTLHAKCIMADNQVMFGTANFNYRSFVHQYEMMLISRNRYLVDQVAGHFEKGLKSSEAFDYRKWKTRPPLNKFLGRALHPFRQFI